ncbi:MAG: hypothetical protein GY759_16860 [Chloroflexi bacterium]|nr:hypothetical protein [Chloroflexota bacterium]
MDTKLVTPEKEQLLEQRLSLLKDIERLRETLRGEVDIDVEEGDPDVVEREKSVALLATIEARLASVDDALKSIERGTYGICDRCGNDIPAERLEVKPDATLCVSCQAEVERLRKRGIASPRTRWNPADFG